MKRFYNLLVRDSMEVDPDLEKIRKGSTADIKAIRNEFRNSKGFKVNLAFACVTKLIFSILFGIWILFISYGTIYTDGKSEPTINDSRVSYSSTPSKWSFIDYIQCTVAEVIYSQLILILLPYDSDVMSRNSIHRYYCLFTFRCSFRVSYQTLSFICTWS